MEKIIVVELKRPARKSGGDRYEADGFVIYIPQEISRKNDGTPFSRISITFKEAL